MACAAGFPTWEVRPGPMRSAAQFAPPLCALLGFLLRRGVDVFRRRSRLLEEGLHELRVLHDLRAVRNLGKGLLVAGELLQDPLTQDLEMEVLADCETFHHVARRD